MASGTTQLSTSQRCSWLYLTAQRDFVRSLAALSEELYTPRSGVPVIERRPEAAAARQKLRTLVAGMFIPPLAYVPLCSSSEKFRRVVRIPPREVGVFVTRERASALLLVEVQADKHRRKLAHLFEGVRTDKKSAAVFDDLRLLPHRPLSWLEMLMRRSDAEEEEPLPPPVSDDESPQSKAPPQPARKESAAGVGEVSVGAGRSLDSFYGELWEEKVARIRRDCPHGGRSGWALLPIISKANDDVRQEVFVMQLLRFLSGVFPPPLWLQPYHILSTGTRSGLLQFLPNTQSLHALKRQPAFGSLDQHFRRHYGSPASPSGARARNNFVSSLAAYSMATYILGIKDRHNGNILLDREGHLIHIDFGFVLGRAPGGRAALEHAAPFKLTREMVDVLGGPDSPLYRDTFVDLCTTALRVARAHSETLLALTEMTGYRSAMSCFVGGVGTPLEQLRDRLMLDVPDSQLRSRVEGLIELSFNNVYTRAYDEFQKWSNGIAY
jgi:phosphatidylinositol 4-kinase